MNLVRARFWGQGWSLPSPVAWLWAVCGCSPGPAVIWQPSSRRRWLEKLCLVAVVAPFCMGFRSLTGLAVGYVFSVLAALRGDIGINLVDPASSHMLVSKIKPCMSQYKLLHGETANGSLKQLSFIW